MGAKLRLADETPYTNTVVVAEFEQLLLPAVTVKVKVPPAPLLNLASLVVLVKVPPL